MDNRILNSIAVHKLATENPSIILSASKIIMALIMSRNNPNVTMVIGSVKITRIGFTNTFSMARTAATISAVV
jgi:hypothetical protein